MSDEPSRIRNIDLSEHSLTCGTFEYIASKCCIFCGKGKTKTNKLVSTENGMKNIREVISRFKLKLFHRFWFHKQKKYWSLTRLILPMLSWTAISNWICNIVAGCNFSEWSSCYEETWYFAWRRKILLPCKLRLLQEVHALVG